MAIGQMARSRVSPSADAVASGGASAVEVAGAADGTTKRVASSKVLLRLGGHVDDTSSVGCGVGGGTSAALVKLFFPRRRGCTCSPEPLAQVSTQLRNLSNRHQID